MSTLTTPRLILRRYEARDHEPHAALNADPEVREFFPGLMSRADSDAMIARFNAHIDQHGYGFWTAELRATSQSIGFVGISRPSFDSAHLSSSGAPFVVEIGWRLARHAWGQGLATEGARASLDYAFDVAGLEEIVSFTVPKNVRSRAVMARLGMRFDYEFDHPKVEEGSPFRRHVLYRIDAATWRKARAPSILS